MIIIAIHIIYAHIYEKFHVNCPSAARERQIVLDPAHVYDTKTYLKKFYDERFRRIFSKRNRMRKSRRNTFPARGPTRYSARTVPAFVAYYFVMTIESRNEIKRCSLSARSPKNLNSFLPDWNLKATFVTLTLPYV